MPSYAALLRGIAPSNPNMRNEKLRGVFERLGFDRVSSVISSGNILFASDSTDVSKLESTIEQALSGDLGITSTTLLRTREELSNLVASDPFGGLSHSRETYLTVSFVKDGSALEHPLASPPAEIRLMGVNPAARAVCAVTDTTADQTPDFMRWLEQQLGKDITTRTYRTVERILARMPD